MLNFIQLMPKAAAPANLFVDFDWVTIGSTFVRHQVGVEMPRYSSPEPSTALMITRAESLDPSSGSVNEKVDPFPSSLAIVGYEFRTDAQSQLFFSSA
jgi:hypothetical protein